MCWILYHDQNVGNYKQERLATERIRTGGEPLISFGEIKNATLASFAAMESAESRTVVSL